MSLHQAEIPRELLLMHHGQSIWEHGIEDIHHPLANKGKRQAQRVGVWLEQQQLLPDRVLSSNADCAITSAEKTCKAMGIGSQRVQPEPRLYGGELEPLLQVLKNSPATVQRILLVGHNPGLEKLMSYLTGTTPPEIENGTLLPTASVARLRVAVDWQSLVAGCANILSLTRPGDLPKQFPFPTAGGMESRDRPAYYYVQSSVIPYRLQQGQLEILLIRSSKQKHWVVPKGIKEPGLSPRASAAKEALEEAGIIGEVGERPLGHYSYEKWGGSCNVEVFPMAVNHMLPEFEWRERHRGREWLTADLAAQRLKQGALKAMIVVLADRLLKPPQEMK